MRYGLYSAHRRESEGAPTAALRCARLLSAMSDCSQTSSTILQARVSTPHHMLHASMQHHTAHTSHPPTVVHIVRPHRMSMCLCRRRSSDSSSAASRAGSLFASLLPTHTSMGYNRVLFFSAHREFDFLQKILRALACGSCVLDPMCKWCCEPTRLYSKTVVCTYESMQSPHRCRYRCSRVLCASNKIALIVS